MIRVCTWEITCGKDEAESVDIRAEPTIFMNDANFCNENNAERCELYVKCYVTSFRRDVFAADARKAAHEKESESRTTKVAIFRPALWICITYNETIKLAKRIITEKHDPVIIIASLSKFPSAPSDKWQSREELPHSAVVRWIEEEEEEVKVRFFNASGPATFSTSGIHNSN